MNIATQFAKYMTVALLSAASDWLVFTTLFTAFTMTRLIMAWWVRTVRPQTVPI